MGRRVAFALSVLGSLLLLPAAGVPSHDSFPLSDYPMFSTARPARATLAHVVVERPDGRWEPAPPHLLGTDQVMTARALAATAAADADAADALCRAVAERVGDGAVTVAVRVDDYDVVGYFIRGHLPEGGHEVTRCPAA